MLADLPTAVLGYFLLPFSCELSDFLIRPILYATIPRSNFQ